MKEDQNSNNKIPNNETSNNSFKSTDQENNSSENNISQSDIRNNYDRRQREKPENISSNHKAPIPRYYNKNMGQITIKADKELVESIKQIAMDEERTIQTVTNRLLEKALDLYEEERSHYLR